MQRHLDEGNVGVGSMVWREDWFDWVKAEDVFPEFVQLVREQRRQSRLRIAMQASGIQPSPPKNPKRRSNVWITILISLAGLLIVAVLCVIAVRVISDDLQSDQAPIPAEPGEFAAEP